MRFLRPCISLTLKLTTPYNHSKALETKRYAALDKWTAQLTSLQSTMLGKSANAGAADRSASMGMGAMGGFGMGLGGHGGLGGMLGSMSGLGGGWSSAGGSSGDVWA